MYKRQIQEKTEGRIHITCYPDSQLGSDAELVEGVQLGNVTMVIGNTAPQVTFVPNLALFDLPNTYDDITTAQKVLTGFTDKMAASFEAVSYTHLDVYKRQGTVRPAAGTTTVLRSPPRASVSALSLKS